MVRIIGNDFDQLKGYISSYSLTPVFKEPLYLSQLSRLHKRYFALLTFIAELEADDFAFATTTYGLDKPSKLKLTNYTKEAISDLGNALFNWIHGAYKGSRLLTRSCIENMVRGLSILEDTSVSEITVTHKLFEAASKLSIFTTGSAQVTFQNLKGNYTELCKDVHTADVINMEHLTALIYFPAFDNEKASKTLDIYVNVAQQCLVLLSLCFREFIFSMHRSNIDTIFLNLPKALKAEVHNP